MYSFLNQSQLTELQNTFSNHFDTFASGNNNYALIIKEPIKIVNNPSEQVLAGYGAENMDITSVTYQPVTGIFPAIVIYPNQIQTNQFGQLKFELDENQIMIKVQQSARDFIRNGKTERIVIDGNTYGETEYSDRLQNFFGLKYYYIKLIVSR